MLFIIFAKYLQKKFLSSVCVGWGMGGGLRGR